MEITTFTTKLTKIGGSKGIIIPPKILQYEAIKETDMIKVMIKKLPKKK